MKKNALVSFGLIALALSGCGGGVSTVAGKATFILGGSAVTRESSERSPRKIRSGQRLTPGDQYIVSPNKAKVTFKTIVFKTPNANTTATLTNCVVTYDRSNPSGTSLLDCPFDVPTGDISQLTVTYSTTLQIYLDDTTNGIYSSAAANGGFSTTRPTPSPDFVDFLVTAGAGGSERQATIVLGTPMTIAKGSSPQIFVTTDMIHSLQLLVTGTGTTLGPPSSGTNDPVNLFAGLTKGSSHYFSEATSVESYKITSGKETVRIFFDGNGQPLYLINPFYCGVDGFGKAAWATPPNNGLGGWLGKDSNNVISWALPLADYTSYNVYFTMQDQLTINGTTSITCKQTTSPPPPADGKTYASGAPAMSGGISKTLRLLSR